LNLLSTIVLLAGLANAQAAGVSEEPAEATVVVQLELAVPGPMPKPGVRLRSMEVLTLPVLEPPGRPAGADVGGGAGGGIIRPGYSLGQAFDRHGRLDASVPAGTYEFELDRLAEVYTIESISAGSRDLVSSPLVIEPGTTTEIRVVLGTTAPNPWKQVGGRIAGVPGSASIRPITLRLSNSELFVGFDANIAEDGTFLFGEVPPGTYTFGTNGREAGRVLRAGTSSESSDATVTVADDDVLDLELEFEPRAIGVVVVRSFVPDGLPEPRFLLGIGGSGSNTLTGGRFVPEGEVDVEVRNVPAGYVVRAIRSGATDLQRDPLQVSADAIHGVDVWFGTEPEIPGRAVRGTVPRLEHLDWVPDRVFLSSLSQNAEAAINDDGTFEVAHLLPDSYLVSLASGSSPGGRFVGLPRVDVQGSGDEPIEIEIPRPRTIHGRIVVDSPDAEQLRLRIERRNAEGTTLGNPEVGLEFSIDVVEGETIQVANLPFGYRVESLAYGALDLMGGPIRFGNDEDASLVVRLVEAPETTGDPDFAIQGWVDGLPERERSVLGKMADALGWFGRFITGRRMTPAPAAHLRLRYGEPDESFSLVAPVAGDGAFAFRRLPAGEYELWIAEATNSDALARVVVGDTDIVDLRLTMPRAVVVDGRVVTADGRALPDLSGTRFVARANTSYFPRRVEPNGSFRTTLTEGDRFVFLDGLPEGHIVESIRYGSADLMNEALRLNPARPISTMEFVLRSVGVE